MAFFRSFVCADAEIDQGLLSVESRNEVRELISRSSCMGVRIERRRRLSCNAPRKGERVPFARTMEPGVRVVRRGRRALSSEFSACVCFTFAVAFVFVSPRSVPRTSCGCSLGLRQTTSIVAPEESSSVKRKM